MGVVLAAPAVADDGNKTLLELSRDGVHFTTASIPSVFENSGSFVPGSSRAGTVWIRNSSHNAAQFSLGVENSGDATGSVLPEYLQLQAQSANRGPAAGLLPDPGNCAPVLEGWALAAGETIRLDLALNLALEAPNATRNQVSTFQLVFLLQGLDGGKPIVPCHSAYAVPAMDVSLGTVPVTGGTASGTRFTGAGEAVPSGQGETSAGPDGTPDAPYQAKLMPDPLLQSNVVANERSPWPWLVVLSAAAYMLVSLRRRRRTQ